MPGISGSLSGPVAVTRNRAVSVPEVVSMRQTCAAGSHRAAVTSAPNRICPVTPSSAATLRRYSQISGCGEKLRVQPGFGANEKQYRWEGTSQAAPG